MKMGEIFYYIAMFGFGYITFLLVRNNFRSKFDEDGNRKDLKD
jgi:hypothetical protein